MLSVFSLSLMLSLWLPGEHIHLCWVYLTWCIYISGTAALETDMLFAVGRKIPELLTRKARLPLL